MLEPDVPVLVDYWAPWGGPRRVVGPVVERIADEHVGSLKVAKVNVDDEPELATAAGVHGIPFLAVYRNGEPVGTLSTRLPSTPSSTLSSWVLRPTTPRSRL